MQDAMKELELKIEEKQKQRRQIEELEKQATPLRQSQSLVKS